MDALTLPVTTGQTPGGPDIRRVKIALNRLGFYTPPKNTGITADAEAGFRMSLKAFQRSKAIPAGEGIGPGSLTERVLTEALARHNDRSLYTWRTVGDGKVRGTHRLREGRRFLWDDPPEGGHPGEDFGCRCWAEPLAPIYNPWLDMVRAEEERRRQQPHPDIHEANAAAAAGTGFVLWNGLRISLQACRANPACRAWLARQMAQAILGNVHHIPPKTLPAFPDAKEVKRRGKRVRWKDSKDRIYEWDSRHGEVEIYDKTGKKHLGAFDPKTGKKLKEGKPGRKVKR